MATLNIRQIATVAPRVVLFCLIVGVAIGNVIALPCLIYGVATGSDGATEFARDYYTVLVIVTGLVAIAANAYLTLKRNGPDGPRIAAGCYAATKSSRAQWVFGVLIIGLLFASGLAPLAIGMICVILSLRLLRHHASTVMATNLDA
ncbi:MAG: hypothetical protein AWU57_472 [Marinobacter sp. T13-3]|nr:MAG: hypothetical protein AWU57_472 [Marinobacter sp. T13-3]